MDYKKKINSNKKQQQTINGFKQDKLNRMIKQSGEMDMEEKTRNKSRAITND